MSATQNQSKDKGIKKTNSYALRAVSRIIPPKGDSKAEVSVGNTAVKIEKTKP